MAGVPESKRRCVLVDGDEPAVKAVPSHLHRQLSVVPPPARGDRAGRVVTVGRRAPRDIVWVHAWAPSCAAVVGSGVSGDRKSTRLNSSHANISYAVFCL